MLDSFSCEICGKQQWETLGVRTYAKPEASMHPPRVQKLFHILFEVWCPGQEEVIWTAVICQHCGFLCHSPRPEVKDINAKYATLATMKQGEKTTQEDLEVVQKRGKELFRYIKQRVDLSKINRILDYGGMDGSLMKPFMDRGKSCFLVDYQTKFIPGITKLGETIDSLPQTEVFDLIICNHVVEHVAEPYQLLLSLAKHLSEGGILYVEVPLEIWTKPPFPVEPVTHINYFTPGSLSYLFKRCHLLLHSCQMGGYLSMANTRGIAIRGIGEKPSLATREQGFVELTPNSDTRHFLNPGLLDRIRHYRCVPDRIPHKLHFTVKQYARRILPWRVYSKLFRDP